MKIVIDRIEGDIAVCEIDGKRFVNLPVALFENASERDIYLLTRDDSAREESLNKAQSLFDKLKKK
ncbi:MAG: DUF3006 domain-containing protein [Clostridia bacterium]|nr:DUF3006 domain-containing protein [Clostridia bacterium]